MSALNNAARYRLGEEHCLLTGLLFLLEECFEEIMTSYLEFKTDA